MGCLSAPTYILYYAIRVTCIGTSDSIQLQKGHGYSRPLMSRLFYISFARLFMTMRECLVQDRSQEISEQAVADLNACLDQLLERCRLIESNIEACTRQSTQIAQRASTESPAFRARSLQTLRQCLLDRRQYRLEHDRASRSVAMLRRQIGTILNSHVDTAIIHAMRQYSTAASRLGLPDKTVEVQRLTDELGECLEHSNSLQDALGEVSEAFASTTRMDMSGEDADADLQAELEALLSSEPTIETPPAAIARAAPNDHKESEPSSAGAINYGTETVTTTLGLRQRTQQQAATDCPDADAATACIGSDSCEATAG